MRRLLIVISLVAVFGLIFLTNRAVWAEQTTLQLNIEGLGCTLDTTYSQALPEVSIQPDDCQKDPVVARIQAQEIAVPVEGQGDNSATDATPGDQKVFEDTPIEPLANWIGVGNPDASPARPIVATGVLAITTTTIVDAMFFELRMTQAVWAFSRVRFAALLGVLFRGS